MTKSGWFFQKYIFRVLICQSRQFLLLDIYLLAKNNLELNLNPKGRQIKIKDEILIWRANTNHFLHTGLSFDEFSVLWFSFPFLERLFLLELAELPFSPDLSNLLDLLELAELPFSSDLSKFFDIPILIYLEGVVNLLLIYCPMKSAKRFLPLISGFWVLIVVICLLKIGKFGTVFKLALFTDIKDGFFASSFIWLKSVVNSSNALLSDKSNVTKAYFVLYSISSYLFERWISWLFNKTADSLPVIWLKELFELLESMTFLSFNYASEKVVSLIWSICFMKLERNSRSFCYFWSKNI